MGQTPSIENTLEFIHESELGTLKGLTFLNGKGEPTCHRLTRVRFSKPVTGENRFSKPESLPQGYDYSGEYKEFGLACPQPAVTTPPMDKVYYRKKGDEDTGVLNIWIPSSDKYKPANGWPVLVYLYGGFLKYGAPSFTTTYHPNHLFDDDHFTEKFIIVAPNYRINLFGFLASKELLEVKKHLNPGFWDQRLAIEWTFKNIAKFGGDPEKLVVGGVSAGLYAAFFQLAYELYHPDEPRYIKKLALFSNCIFIQPKPVEELQVQFDELLSKLEIDPELSGQLKIKKLEEIDLEVLVDQINKMKYHTYRAVTDDDFVSSTILKDIDSGKFGELMVQHNVDLLIGETSNEGSKYATFNSPTSIEDLKLQVLNFYPSDVCEVLFKLYNLDGLDPSLANFKNEVKNIFGRIIADGQVYNSSRGFLSRIVENGGFPETKIYRYQVDFLNEYYKPHCPSDLKGVPHGLDVPHWFYALDDGINAEEAQHLKIFLKPYLKWLNFQNNDEIQWGTSNVKELRKYCEDGSTKIVQDDRWDWGLKVSDAVYSL